MRPGNDFFLNSVAKPFIKAAMFTEHIRTVCLLSLENLRTRATFGRDDAVLLTDNAVSHITEGVLGFL
jgi:hypothetical protein